ncbi:hypothetical protein [Trinickia caryophylli]|uniref:hypothetical protein n=1 Tax=Trinickia caryophylli TaxID=28094 RepID=UPI000A165B39|nr:hypothetical protein [Trinickia caryophylli]PMS09526.1 hypothetical protein C0Z17_24525 [Trinickia caryophylli]TRX14436.1 hypothetical protein FNF07_24500 [Trinickia caryophylli]WQE14273.1 hypothetical protein U0034_26690 [Trinickia caryophylli]GLU33216.1 hypothetical protein Busp01_30580 [Trinickia caryophylli]
MSGADPRPEFAEPAIDEPEQGAAQAVPAPSADDLLGAGQLMNFDPRQRTLMGFELPEDTLAALRTQAAQVGADALPPAVPAAEPEPKPEPKDAAALAPVRSRPAEADTRAQAAQAAPPTARAGAPSTEPSAAAGGNPPRQTEGVPGPEVRVGAAAAPRTPPPARPVPAPMAESSPARTAWSPEPLVAPRPAAVEPALPIAQDPALAQTVAALSRSLADECRRAEQGRRRAARWLAATVVVSGLLLASSVAEIVMLTRTLRETTEAQRKTEALLRSQQSALAAFVDTAQAASADIHGTAEALTAKLAALSARTPAVPQAQRPEPAAVRRHTRSPRVRKAGDKPRSAAGAP